MNNDDPPESAYTQKRRRKRREFDKRVKSWLYPTCGLDADLANDLAKSMGRDTYATFAETLNVKVVDRPADPAYMAPQAVQQRAAAGKMLLNVAVSAQYGSKWEGQVTFGLTSNSSDFITACEAASSLVLTGYVVSYNGRLLRSENVLHDIGIRDGYKVVLLPMKAGLAKRPEWSVRQSEAVTFLLPEKARKLKVTEQTQEDLRELLGKDRFEAYKISGLTMQDPKSVLDPKELEKEQKMERTRAANAALGRTDMYEHIWGDKTKPKYKRRELAPLCDWTSDKSKMARASRPLQNYESAMKQSMSTTLMGKKDPTVPPVSSMSEWFSTYGQSENFFKSGSGMDQTGSRENMYGYCDKKAQGFMSRFEKSRRMVGSERSKSVTLRTGKLTA